MTSKLLLASDYDGTLKRNGTVSAEDIEAIHSFQAAGNIFCLCTGRCPQAAAEEMKKCGLEPDLLICASGAAGCTMEGEFIFRHPLPDSAIESLWRIGMECKTDCTIAYPSDGSMLRVFYKEPEKSDTTLEALLQSKDLLQMNTRFLADPPAAKAYTERVRAELPAMAAHPNGLYIDCTAKGIDKATGVAETAAHFGVPLESCYTVGDHGNDLAMLLPYHGYVIESGDPETIAKVGRTVPGIAALIKKII